MSGSARRRSSKWDLKEDSHFHPRFVQGDTLRNKHDVGLPSGEPFARSRVNSDNNMRSHWDRDGSYKMDMSPGLEDWRRRDLTHSPKRDWSRSLRSKSSSRSRSRSRSPAHRFGRDIEVYDRSMSRSALSTQLGVDISAGRSARGSHGQHRDYHQQPNQDHDAKETEDKALKYYSSRDARDHYSRSGRSAEICNKFLNGTCLRGSSCKYIHDSASRVYGRGSADDILREREHNRGNRYRTSEQGDGRGSESVPCRYFAAGNCRNGKYCRFSHDQSVLSPNRRPQDRNWDQHHNMDDVGKMFNDQSLLSPNRRSRDRNWDQHHNMNDVGKMLNDQSVLSPNRRSRDRNWDQHHNLDDVETLLKDSKSSDTKSVSEAATWCDNKKEISASGDNKKEISAPEHKVASWSIHDASGFNNNGASKTFTDETDNKVAGVSQRECLQLRNEETCTTLGASEPRGTKEVPGETAMSPGWDFKFKSTSQSSSQELKPVNGDKATFQVNSNVLPTENVASREQLIQLNSLSSSLAQLIANGSQLPHIYANLTSHISTDVPSFINSGGPVKPESSAPTQSNPPAEPKQYDPISDSVDMEQPEFINRPPGFPPNPVDYQDSSTIQDGSLVFPDNASPSLGATEINNDFQKNVHLESTIGNHNFNQPKGHEGPQVVTEDDRKGAQESEKPLEDKKITDGGSLDNADTVTKVEEDKKSKDLKGIRTFKFALVDVVKELLKPAWKEGKIDKEAHKAIVKKAVDKVTGTLQGTSIPQTKEKIDHYLSTSRPKLNKLLEAYVGRFQKSKTDREAS